MQSTADLLLNTDFLNTIAAFSFVVAMHIMVHLERFRHFDPNTTFLSLQILWKSVEIVA